MTDSVHLRGDVELRIGRPGEEYGGIRKDVVHVEGRRRVISRRSAESLDWRLSATTDDWLSL